MSSITELKKPIRRRRGNLVIEVATEGLTLRGHRCRTSLTVTWAQVASLAAADEALLCAIEEKAGRRVLADLHADPRPMLEGSDHETVD